MIRAAAILLVAISPAWAHPMGDLSISHYAGIEIGADAVDVKFLLDFAETPSVRELERVDPDRDDRVTPEERERYLEAKTAEILPLLRLEVNGRPLVLRSEWRSVSFPTGESGLSTVRVAWKLRADLPADVGDRNFLLWSDSCYDGTDGWKEIRFTGIEGRAVGKTSLREQPASDELATYPEEFLWRPPKDTKAWCQFGAPHLMTRASEASPSPAAEPSDPGPPPAATGPRGVAVGGAILALAVVLALAARRARGRAG